MKKLVAILALVLFAGSTVFAAVHDNITDESKTGKGTFKCTVITPLTINLITTNTNGDINLGEFVANTTPYIPAAEVLGTDGSTVVTPAEKWEMQFKITGEKAHSFFYKIDEQTTSPAGATGDAIVATLEMNWTIGATIDPSTAATAGASTKVDELTNGEYFIKANVSKINAKKAGEASFPQTVTVSYNSL